MHSTTSPTFCSSFIAGTIILNLKKTLDKKYIEIEKDSEVEITYEIMSEFDEGDVYVMLMDIDNYERHMEAIKERLEPNIMPRGI